MANTINPIDFLTEDLATFLAKTVDDGTYADIVQTLKTDQVGEEAAATQIAIAAGQLWSNLEDDFFLKAYPLLRSVALGTSGWKLKDSTAVNMGANGALYLFDDALTDSHNTNTLVLQAGTEKYVELMGKTFLVLDGASYFKAVHDATLDSLGDLTISFVGTYRGTPPTATQDIVGYGDDSLSGADSDQNVNYKLRIAFDQWTEIHENGLGINNTSVMAIPDQTEVGMLVGMWHMTRDAATNQVRWYFNRNLVSVPAAYVNDATTGAFPAQELWVGADATGGFFSSMWLADLKINPGTVLSQAQIDAEYEQVFG